jgi:flagellar protein FliO/FliZ
MFESLFGAEMPLAIRFFLAFLIVLGLIGVTAWAVRRFGTGRLGSSTSRGRQPRLAVIDYASVDARRRLILVRRDNVEHLLMIGGPTDVVVESNIVRAVAPPRDIALARPPGAAEALPRAIPLPESGNGSWPLQPEPTHTAPPRSAPRIEPIPGEPTVWPLQPDTPKRPQRETLAALADELSSRTALPRSRTSTTSRAQPAEARGESNSEPAAEPEAEPRASETRTEPRITSIQTEPVDAASADQSLAEMAHRLEAALRKPSTTEARQPRMPSPPRTTPLGDSAPAPQRAAPPVDHAPGPAPMQPRSMRPAEPKPARTDGKTSQGKSLYDSLEQEMASLLGRPTNKT